MTEEDFDERPVVWPAAARARVTSTVIANNCSHSRSPRTTLVRASRAPPPRPSRPSLPVAPTPRVGFLDAGGSHPPRVVAPAAASRGPAFARVVEASGR